MRIAVYTAIFNDYDVPRAPVVVSPGCDYFIFTESDKVYPAPFRTIKVPRREDDPRREARRYKILSHEIFPISAYNATVWFDGEVQLLSDTEQWCNSNLVLGVGLAVKTHPDRSCLYDEAAICSELRFDHPETIAEQTLRYRREGFPSHLGLAWTNVLLRRNNSDIAAFNNLWYKELAEGSRRDQISFPYAAWKMAIKINYLSVEESAKHEGTFGHQKSERKIS